MTVQYCESYSCYGSLAYELALTIECIEIKFSLTYGDRPPTNCLPTISASRRENAEILREASLNMVLSEHDCPVLPLESNTYGP